MADSQHQTDVAIVGAGPVGLFAVFECGMLGLKCQVIDALEARGGQCRALYPDKPIYDIPAIPVCTGEELTEALLKQIEPFNAGMHLGEEVTVVQRIDDELFRVETSGGKEFEAIVARAAESAGLGVSPSPGGGGRSDHAPFIRKDIPSMHFFSGHHSDYHKPTDDADKINALGGARVTSMIYDIADELAAAGARPTFQQIKSQQPARSGGTPTYRVVMGLAPGYGDDGKPGMAVEAVQTKMRMVARRLRRRPLSGRYREAPARPPSATRSSDDRPQYPGEIRRSPSAPDRSRIRSERMPHAALVAGCFSAAGRDRPRADRETAAAERAAPEIDAPVVNR